jgi:thiol-disulfide isomerase/thioredoxin
VCLSCSIKHEAVDLRRATSEGWPFIMLLSFCWPRRALICGFLLLTLAGSTSHAAPQIGSPAPVIDLPTLASQSAAPKLGPMLSLPLEPGRVVIVDFYATWCVPCQKASLALSEVLAQLGDRVTLIVVDVKESPEVVSQHLAKLPLPKGAKLVFDRDGEAAKRWGQDRFPTTFLGPGYKARIDRWLRLMLGIPAQMTPE